MSEKPTRQITDARVLAALAHPLRGRLLDVLRVYGPATVSGLAERTDQAVGNISHHLKTLAAAELVEPAPELARDRRERWWRVVPGSLRWSSRDFGGDAASEAIELAANSLNVERQLAFVHAFAAAPQQERESWPTGPFATQSWLMMTDDELRQFGEETIALQRRWSDRELPEDGALRRPVLTFARAVPATP